MVYCNHACVKKWQVPSLSCQRVTKYETNLESKDKTIIELGYRKVS